MRYILLLGIIMLMIIVFYFYRNNIKEYFVSQTSKSYDSNEFKPIVLDKIDNYDIELAIPSGQYLHNTIQGNWGFSTDETNNGVVFGVYRDGYTSDGSVFKGISGKRYKYMLEQGPYIIKYEVRKNDENKNDGDSTHDVSIYVDDKLIKHAEGEGVSADKLKVIGTNYHNYNNEAKGNGRGRRPVDYLKFIPKDTNGKISEGFTNDGPTTTEEAATSEAVATTEETASTVNESSEQQQQETTTPNVNFTIEVKKSHNLGSSSLEEGQFVVNMCREEGLFCNKIQDFNINTQTGEIYYGGESNNDGASTTEDTNDPPVDMDTVKDLFNSIDEDSDGILTTHDIKTLLTHLNLDTTTHDNVINRLTPEGMNWDNFESILGGHIKKTFQKVHEKNGKQGMKLVYKLWGYDYPDTQSSERSSAQQKREQQKLNAQFPETDYDRSKPSKTRYRTDYKPENPRPEKGVGFYDSIWDFSKNN